jgi:putative colanic acid biosynthesis UDP-glucose lipid carrier transferase
VHQRRFAAQGVVNSVVDHKLGTLDGAHPPSAHRVRLVRTPEILDQRVALAVMLLRILDPLTTVAILLLGAVWLRLDITFLERATAAVAALLVFSLFRDVAEGQPWRRGGHWPMVARIVGSWMAMAGLLIMVGVAAGIIEQFSPQLAELWLLATPVVMVLYHSAVRAVLLAVSRTRRRSAVAVALTGVSLALRRALQDAEEGGVEFCGFFDDRSAERLGLPNADALLGRLAQTADYVRQHKVDLVYIALPVRGDARVEALLDGLRDSTASVYFVPDLHFVDLLQARVDQVGGIPVIGVWETPYYGVNAVVKRSFDALFSVLALVVLSPLLAAIAVGVKFGSPGPVLFKQRRYGFGGEEIRVYKFRTMTVCEDGPNVPQARRDDDRITPLGRLLRRLSLDELPQFINVLQGRMSVVGPRPHAVAHNEHYRRLISGYMHRHKVKPGITGWAQVNGLRGETDTLDKMRARVEYDLEYLRNWSPSLDLRIVLRTAALVFRDAHAF